MNYKSNLLILFIILSGVAFGQPNRVEVNDQEIFVSGMNLAWGNFARDLTAFNEQTFVDALDDISNAGGNTMRWWVHVNGTSSPQFTNGKVSGITENEIANVKKVLDLAAERNMCISLCLWSFDMLQSGQGVNYEQNRNLLQDTAYTHAYINNALVPMVRELKGHKAILCWEIFNEPEGMTREFGWTPEEEKTEMKYVQQFINLTAGAIHREAPDEKVSNGSWSFRAASDINEYTNYYTDERLIAAGGDTLGTLDFYMVHYYDWGGTALSPFHHPVNYWELDKPLVIGEFSANGPYTGISTKQAYKYLYENGYAGSLSWTWTNHDGHGGVDDAAPGMMYLLGKYPDDIVITFNADINYPPVPVNDIPPVIVPLDLPDSLNLCNLQQVFTDYEDAGQLDFSVASNSNPDLVEVNIDSDDNVDLSFNNGQVGNAIINIDATDSGGKKAITEFLVQVYNPNSFNLALFQSVKVSSEPDGQHVKSNAVDGNPDSKWTSGTTNGQWLQVELDNSYALGEIIIKWGNKYPTNFEILTSTNGSDWEHPYLTTQGDGNVDKIEMNSLEAQFIRVFGQNSNTNNGISIRELEVYQSPTIISSATGTPTELTVYPNPVHSSGFIQVKVDQPSKLMLRLYNNHGICYKSIYKDVKKAGDFQVALDTRHLISGIYWVGLTTSTQKSACKFIVN